MVDELLSQVISLLEAEHAACQRMLELEDQQRECVIASDGSGLAETTEQLWRASSDLEQMEFKRLALLRRYGCEDAKSPTFAALLLQAPEATRQRYEGLRRSMASAAWLLKARGEANMRLVQQAHALTGALAAALTQAHRAVSYSANGAPPTASSASLLVDSRV